MNRCNHSNSFIVVCLLLAASGCREALPPPTLTVHAHDGLLDLLDHDDHLIDTADDLEAFKAMLNTPKIRSVIQSDRVVVRFVGVQTADGLSFPDELGPVLAALFLTGGITDVEFEYMED